MFMKYDTGSHQWIFRIMYIPHMSDIPGHDGYIPVIHINNLKIPRIQTFKIFPAKHLLPPFQNTSQQFHRQLRRHTLRLLLFFTCQNILNRLFRNILSHLPHFHCLLRFQFLSLILCHLLDQLLHLRIQIG